MSQFVALTCREKVSQFGKHQLINNSNILRLRYPRVPRDLAYDRSAITQTVPAPNTAAGRALLGLPPENGRVRRRPADQPIETGRQHRG